MKQWRAGHLLLTLSLAVMLIAALVACQSGSQDRTPQAANAQVELVGTVRVSGAWALYPMMVRWGEEFSKIHPKVRIDISAGGAGKGLADAVSGLVDIGMVSREIRPEEVQQGAFYVSAVKDAVFPTINANNPVLQGSLDQQGARKAALVDLWMKGKPLTWGEVAGTDSRDTVQVYTRSDACGAAEMWAKYLGGAQEDLHGTAVYGDPGLAEAVRNDRLGIGYNNLNYAYDATTGLPVQGLAIMPLDVNDNGRIDAEEDLSTKAKAIAAIASGAYPSPPARYLYLVTKDQFSGVSREFVRWILTDGQKFADEVGYIRLPEAIGQESLNKLGQ